MNDMGFAGPPAVFVGGAFAEEHAEHTVLHMKHRHVLVEGQFEPIRRRAAQQVEGLSDIEIVGNRESVESGMLHEQAGSDRVGDVEREVADAAAVGEEFQVVVVADRYLSFPINDGENKTGGLFCFNGLLGYEQALDTLERKHIATRKYFWGIND